MKKELFNKAMLCDLVADHLEEFKGMTHDEIMDCFLGPIKIDQKEIYAPFRSRGEAPMKYSVYFKMISPKLNYHHEIICAIELREKADVLKEGEIPACAGMSMLMLLQAKEERKEKNISHRCYGFYLYTNGPSELKGISNQYNANVRSNNTSLLKNNIACGIEVYL